MNKVIFLDRDGVINEERNDYVKGWEEFKFLPGSISAIRKAFQSGYEIVIVSNQSAVGRGIISLQRLEDIHNKMVEAVEREGGEIKAVYYCPHSPEEGCDCRKPRPGLFYRAVKDLGLVLNGSFFIGDSETDIEVGLRVGCRVIFVTTKLDRSGIRDKSMAESVEYYARNLEDAVDYILKKGET